jgi:glucokinase
MAYALGIDLGGTKLAAGLVDEDGRIARKVKMAVEGARVMDQIAEAAALGEAEAVGIVVPGIYYPDTGAVWAPNLFGWDTVPLGEQVGRRLRRKVAIDSDRAGYVLGEQWVGAARGLSDVVFVAVGTGIGAGIMAGGQVLRGRHGTAGAVGWLALDPRWTAEYEKHGCWEWEAAGPALARQAGAAHAEEVVEAARRGEAAAADVLQRAASYLGMGIANLVSALDPDMVVLGGGLLQGAGDLLLEPVRHEVLRWAQPISAPKVRVELSSLGEDAGLLGAARLALGDAVRVQT